jgi:DNA polymerase IV
LAGGVRLSTIVHLDADAFFVSVELAARPDLRGRKVAVGGGNRGIISSASYEARAAGVYTPMPSRRALAVCPDLVLLPHRGPYGAVSRRMFALCETLTPLVQRNSIDEGYLDLGPCGYRDQAAIEAVVRDLQRRIWDELQIPVSFGVATNRLVSQIASKARKPRGFVVVPPGEEAVFLAPLTIGALPGVGPKSEATLQARGIRLIGDVPGRSDSELVSVFGRDWREMVARCRGEDDRPVETEREAAKSYSQQETFAHDIADRAEIERIAKRMIDELLPGIRAEGRRVRTLTLKVRHGDFSERSAGHSLPEASDLESDFYAWVGPLLRQAWPGRRALRLVSVRFSGVEEGARQLGLFAEGDERKRRLAAVMDRLNAGGKTPRVTHGHQLGAGD